MDNKPEDIGRGNTRLPQQSVTTVTGISGTGTTTTSTAAGTIDNSQSGNIFNGCFIVIQPTSKNGDIFDNIQNSVTQTRSSDTNQSRLQFEKKEGHNETPVKHCAPTCPGTKKPCREDLNMNQDYCNQCGCQVDKSLFKVDKRICKGDTENGSTCNAEIHQGFLYCSQCGQNVLEDKLVLIYTCSGQSSDGEACYHSSPHCFDVCPQCGKSNPRRMRKEISCPGIKHPCGAQLTPEHNFCPKCDWKINKMMFSSASQGTAPIKDGDRFCSKCGTSVQKDLLTVKQSIHLRQDPPHNLPEIFKTIWILSNVQIGAYLIDAMHIGQQVAVLSFLMAISKDYGAVLSQVSEGSLVFTFLHKDEASARRMMDDKENVKQHIEKFLEDLDASVLYDHLDISVEFVIDGEDKIRETAGDSVSETKEPLNTEVDLRPSTSFEQADASQILEERDLYPEHSIAKYIQTASCNGNLQQLKDLIDVSPKTVHIPSHDGYTPLMLACLRCHYDVVKLLLSLKVGVDVKNNQGETTLILACRKSLLHDILEEDDESDIADLACLFAHDFHVKHGTSHNIKFATNIIQLLLSHGADVNAVDDDGFTPLILACIFGDLEVTNILLSSEIKINNTGINGTTALAWACAFGHDKIVKRLLEAGSDINITPTSSTTLLSLSSCFGWKTITDTLVSFGANMNETGGSQMTPLHIASLFGSLNVVKSLLSQDAHVDTAAFDGSTPLICASLSGQSDVVETLALHGGDINHQNENGSTPLMLSALLGHTDAVRLLLTKDVKVNTCSADGSTSLMWACLVGWADIGELLVSAGADVHATNEDGDSALSHACSNVQSKLSNEDDIYYVHDDDGEEDNDDYSDDIKMLASFFIYKSKPRFLEHIINHLNPNSDTVQHFMLGYAVLTDDTDLQVSLQRAFSEHIRELGFDDIKRRDSILKMLLSHQVDINRRNKAGDTALMKACRNGYESGVRMLLEHNVEVNICNKDGNTALILASQVGYKHIVELLLNHKADVNLSRIGFDSPLIEASRNGHVTVVDLLLNHGADANMRSVGNTSLIEASREGHVMVVDILLKNGADVSLRGNDGNTPLIEASRGGNVTAVEMLVSHGADVNTIGSEGTMPLIEACKAGHPAVAEALLKNGAHVNLTGMNGDTPLIEACRGGHGTVIGILLRNGADVTILNAESDTAITVAQKEGQDIAIQVLQKHQPDTNTEAVSSVLHHQPSIPLSPSSTELDGAKESVIEESVDEEDHRKRKIGSDHSEVVSKKKCAIQPRMQLWSVQRVMDVTANIFAYPKSLGLSLLRFK